MTIRGMPAERLTYADILDAEDAAQGYHGALQFSRLAVTFALQSVQEADVSSFGLIPLPVPGSPPVDGREALTALQRYLPELGLVRLDVRLGSDPAAGDVRRVYLVPGVALDRLAKLAGRIGEAGYLFCGPETEGALVAVHSDGTRYESALPSPAEVSRLVSRIAGWKTVAIRYPAQSAVEISMRKARDAAKPVSFDDLGTCLMGDEPARALFRVLENMAPERVRQFIERAILKTAPLASGYESSLTDPVSISLAAPTEAERLTEANGRFVAVRFTEGMDLEYDDMRVGSEFDALDEHYRDQSRDDAPDLRIIDEANGVTILVECQKAYFQTPDRLRRNLGALFVEEADPASMSVDATFAQVLSVVTEIVWEGGDATEVHVVRQFGDWLRDAYLMKQR